MGAWLVIGQQPAQGRRQGVQQAVVRRHDVARSKYGCSCAEAGTTTSMPSGFPVDASLPSERGELGVDVLVDGAHTPASARALIAAVRGAAPPAAAASRSAPVLLVGVAKGKDAAGICAALAAAEPALCVCTSASSSEELAALCTPPSELVGAMVGAGVGAARAVPEVDAALAEAVREARAPHLVARRRLVSPLRRGATAHCGRPTCVIELELALHLK